MVGSFVVDVIDTVNEFVRHEWGGRLNVRACCVVVFVGVRERSEKERWCCVVLCWLAVCSVGDVVSHSVLAHLLCCCIGQSERSNRSMMVFLLWLLPLVRNSDWCSQLARNDDGRVMLAGSTVGERESFPYPHPNGCCVVIACREDVIREALSLQRRPG